MSDHFLSAKTNNVNGPVYVTSTNSINAKLIEIRLNEKAQPQDSYTIHTSGTAKQHFDDYQRAVSEVNFDISVLSPPIAWLNGNRDIDSLRKYPEQLFTMMENMLMAFGISIDDIHGGKGFRELLNKNTEALSAKNDSIESIRNALGSKNGFSDFSKKDNPLQEIWKVIEPYSGGISSDQFFGFAGINGPMSKYQSTIGCCAVLDVIGFHSEKKSRKIPTIPNIQSDASHIAYAIFCDALLSADMRLCERAKAIYKYAGIKTCVIQAGKAE